MNDVRAEPECIWRRTHRPEEYAVDELMSAEEALAEGRRLMRRLQYKRARSAFEEAYSRALSARDRALAEQREQQGED